MLDNVYSAIASGIAAEAPKLITACAAIVAVSFGLSFALRIYAYFVDAGSEKEEYSGEPEDLDEDERKRVKFR